MAQRFEGKVVFIAGATGGLGQAVTMAFLQEGALVVAAGQRPEGFESLRRTAGAAGTRLQPEVLNAADETAVRTLVDAIVTRYKRLDVMVNTIGGYAGGIKLWEMDRKTYDLMFTLNLHTGYTMAPLPCRSMAGTTAWASV